MARTSQRNQQAKKPKPSVGQSVATYGTFIYRTLAFFGIDSSTVSTWWSDNWPEILDRFKDLFPD